SIGRAPPSLHHSDHPGLLPLGAEGAEPRSCSCCSAPEHPVGAAGSDFLDRSFGQEFADDLVGGAAFRLAASSMPSSSRWETGDGSISSVSLRLRSFRKRLPTAGGGGGFRAPRRALVLDESRRLIQSGRMVAWYPIWSAPFNREIAVCVLDREGY